MKKFLSVLLVLTMIFCFAACGNNDEPQNDGEQGEATNAIDYDAISDDCESEDGTYELAFVTDVGQLKDGSFNQFTWNGVKAYASQNEKTYKYYRPANNDKATDADRYDAMKAAVDAGAKVVVAAGFMQGTALAQAAAEFPDTKFVFIDGWVLTDPADAEKEPEDQRVLDNVAAVVYQEEQAGYFAGYAAVMEGLTKLGFSGGGGGTNPACGRYGYGFVQGAEAAAAEKDVDVEMRYSWEYGASFSASPDLQAMLNGWYEAGTECIFMCGGSMFQSGAAAADANEAYLVGVDVDQSGQSDQVITSAMKDLAGSTMDILTAFYADQWADWGGKCANLGASVDRVGLPTDTWKLENWTVEEYNALFEKVKSGEIEVDAAEVYDPSTKDWEHITFVK